MLHVCRVLRHRIYSIAFSEKRLEDCSIRHKEHLGSASRLYKHVVLYISAAAVIRLQAKLVVDLTVTHFEEPTSTTT